MATKVSAKKVCDEKTELGYGFYSKVLKQPFDSLEELATAEAAYFEEQKIKEEATNKKKADAQKVEDAFKALNAARKSYKENLTQLTKEYTEELETLKKAFELGKKDMQNILAEAEETYRVALKAFTDAHPEGYHVTLKDGDFETTISKQTSNTSEEKHTAAYDNLYALISDLFNL